MKYTLSIYSVGALILAGAIGGCAGNRACPGSGCTADDDTTAAVDAALVSNADLGPPNQIQVVTYHHVVYLSGVVESEYQKEVAESVAVQTGGDAEVVSSIAPSN